MVKILNKRKINREISYNKQSEEPKVVLAINVRAKAFIKHGDYIKKLNYDGGSMKKYLKIQGNNLRWGESGNSIDSANKAHSIPLQSVIGLLYGKLGQPFNYPENINLKPWRCFSILISTRTLDFYATDDNID